MSEPLKLGSDGIFSVASELDFEDELNIVVDCDCGFDRYLTIPELKQLNAHLTKLLEGK